MRSPRRPITARSTRSTCGCGRRAAPGRWRPRSTVLPSYQEQRGLDLGAHGAHPRARGVGDAGFAARVEASRSATCCAVSASPHRRRRRRRDARGHRQGKGRRESLGPEIRGRRAGRYRVHRAISAARARRGEAGNSRYLDRAHARQGGALGVLTAEDAEVLRPAVRLLSGPHANPAALPAGRVRSEDRERRRACVCWRAPRTCRISPRCRPTSMETQRQVRECFVRILGKAP